MSIPKDAEGGHANPGGRPKTKPFTDALRAELDAAGEDAAALRDIAAKLVEEARSGNLQAIKELADRLDGKPSQQMELEARYHTISHEEALAQLQ